MTENLDLSEFITGSLCLRGNTNPAVKNVFPSKDPLSSFFEEDPYKIVGDLQFSERRVSRDTVGTAIQEFYRDVNVFITGGSGFIGKVLVEKLVRSMPHIGQVYLLMREKRGKGGKERLQLLLEDKIFSRMKAEVPDYHTKIVVLAGNLAEPNLGLSEGDLELVVNSTHVVFHCAADVKFTEPLRVAIASNVLGSRNVMDLAKRMKYLKAYVHVSTAYSQCVHRVIEEAIPKTNINYKDIMNYVDSNTDSHIEKNLQSILQGWPNTYTFSKGLCENMIQEEAKGLPICIYRPSIVVSTYNEPVRGWTDNLNGPGGLALAGALGILHYLRADCNVALDLVPVDYVVNSMIAVSWDTARKRDTNMLYVYNFTSSQQNMILLKSILDHNKYSGTWPLSQAIWHPSLITYDSQLCDELCHILLHKIPGAVLDKIAVLLGQKPRLTKTYSLIYSVKSVLYYFISRSWEFRSNNTFELWCSMTKEDKEMFNFDVRDINWIEYKGVSWLGGRHFFLKEGMESIPAAMTRYKWLHWAHLSLKLVCGFFVVKMAACAARILPI